MRVSFKNIHREEGRSFQLQSRFFRISSSVAVISSLVALQIVLSFVRVTKNIDLGLQLSRGSFLNVEY